MSIQLQTGSPPPAGTQTSLFLQLPEPAMQRLCALIGPRETCKILLLCRADREEYAKEPYCQHIYVSLYKTANIPFNLTYFQALGSKGREVSDFMHYQIESPLGHKIKSQLKSTYKKIALSGNGISLDKEDLGLFGKKFPELSDAIKNGLREARELFIKPIGYPSPDDFLKIRTVFCEKILELVHNQLQDLTKENQALAYWKLYSEIDKQNAANQWTSTQHAAQCGKEIAIDYPLRLIGCVEKISKSDSFVKMRTEYDDANALHTSSFGLGRKRDPIFNSSDSSDSEEECTTRHTVEEPLNASSSSSDQSDDDDVFSFDL